MKINIVTLGCSKNTVDSENIAGHLKAANHQVFFDRQKNDCDIVIVNTCGFIGDAKEESVNCLLSQIKDRQNFNRCHANDGTRRLLLAVGCLVERYSDELKAEMPEVDAWYGAHQWDALVTDLLAFSNPTASCEAYKQPFVSRRFRSTPKHYAFLKIAEGCNRSCSYCAIPLIRGKHVSRPIEELVAEAQQLVNGGAKELIVISQDTTYYGLDLYGKRCLGELLERLATQSGAQWVRLHYTYPSSFPVDALDVMRRYDNICNYIDIPLQHINSRILGSMQRGIDRAGTLQLLKMFRQKLPDVCVRTTLIVGYPGETEAEFQELKQFVSEAQFDRMGCFAYSPEEGTAAERLGDPVPESEKERRVSELMALQEKISYQKNQSRVGKTYTVLVDRLEGEFYVARTEYDSPEVDDEVLVSAQYRLSVGEFCKVRILNAQENDLFAVPL